MSLLPPSLALGTDGEYVAGPLGRRDSLVTHLFFMDHLKLYASNEDSQKKTLEEVREYYQAVGMKLEVERQSASTS